MVNSGPTAPRVGILAVQGDVGAHAGVLEALGCEATEVLREKDLDGLEGLILPGGESTTISRGIERLRLAGPIRSFAASGGRILGTCAGAILLAREVENHPVACLGLLDVVAVRNAYGTQVDSFATRPDPGGAPELADLDLVFIRAPRLRRPGPGIEVLLRHEGWPVLVREGRIWAATFHPELRGDSRVHRRWLGEALSG